MTSGVVGPHSSDREIFPVVAADAAKNVVFFGIWAFLIAVLANVRWLSLVLFVPFAILAALDVLWHAFPALLELVLYPASVVKRRSLTGDHLFGLGATVVRLSESALIGYAAWYLYRVLFAR